MILASIEGKLFSSFSSHVKTKEGIVGYLTLLLPLQLLSMDWKLGIAMSSSTCKSFNSPYVTLQMKVAESDHLVQQHTLNMTVAQFQVGLIFIPP